MARRRFQSGCLFVRGKKRKVWVARWREEVIRPDGTLGRAHRSEVLGLVNEIPSYRDARKLLEARLRPINEGRHRPQSTMTFKQFVDEKWLHVVSAQNPRSVQTYASKLRRHVLPVFGQKPLNEITRWDVQHFLAQKRQQGYSGAHVHGMRTTLSKILQAAVEWGYLLENPARGIRAGSREPIRERLHLDPVQVQRLVSELPEPCRTLVVVAVLTGLRIGEILALRWGRIDLLRGTITVSETYSSGRFSPPKTRSSKRTVPMSTALREVLLAHRLRCGQVSTDDLVFATRKQRPLNAHNLLLRVLRPLCKALGLPQVSWHSLRHTTATQLGEVGTPARTAQEILGHTDVAMTLNVYTHPPLESQRAALEKMAGVLFPNVPNFRKLEEEQEVN